MSLFGSFTMYCANCGSEMTYPGKSGSGYYLGGEWKVCSKSCFDEIEMKYARSILGKDTLDEDRGQFTPEQQEAIADAIFDNDYRKMNKLKEEGKER